MATGHPPLSPLWFGLWSGTLAVSWLLPNHYFPWLAFHSDAWIALILSAASLAVIWRSNAQMVWHGLPVLVAALVGVIWLQFLFGLIKFTGTAWISSAYVLGLLLAMLTGARWESSRPGQLADGLFLAIGIAALLSVGVQLQQWLQLDGLELWTMGGGWQRPHANFGQPNQLGTFLLWGLLAALWGWLRKSIGLWAVLLMSAYLLFGLALTGSRAAWIGVALLVVMTWVWRRVWKHERLPWVVTGLGLYFAVCVGSKGWLGNFLQGGGTPSPDIFNLMSSQQRVAAWTVFWDAAWQRPWFGYGWNQVATAQLTVTTEHPPLFGVFSYSHNLFLDLILWCGIPLGLLVSVALVVWFWKKIRAVKKTDDAVLLMVLLVVGNHAMVELPLYFAYLLLPAGLVMGALNTRLNEHPFFLIRRWLALCLWLAISSLLVLIIRDYTRVEPNYRNLRLEHLRIKVERIGPPDVLLLSQWHNFIAFARTEPKAGLSTEELNTMRNVASLFPSSLLLHKLATALALNQQPEEAQLWLKKMCTIAPAQECRDAETIWAKQALKYPEIAAVPWPIKE